jgi:hypothetical protein
MGIRCEEDMRHIHRDWVPKTAISSNFLLYTILSVSASDKAKSTRNQDTEVLAITYRQKAFGAYAQALNNISSKNYESLLLTSVYIMALVTPIELPCSDVECFQWYVTCLARIAIITLLGASDVSHAVLRSFSDNANLFCLTGWPRYLL